MNTFFNYSVNDDYETPIEYWKCIEPLIPKDLKINDCFYITPRSIAMKIRCFWVLGKL